MKKINPELRNKILTYIKNGKDISKLIKGYSIKGEKLVGAIILDFSRPDQDMSGVNLARAILGRPDTSTDLSNSIINDAKFYKTVFLGNVIANRVVARNSNFNKTFIPNIRYQYADFRGSSFCGCTMPIDGDAGHGARFSQSLLDNLTNGWIIE